MNRLSAILLTAFVLGFVSGCGEPAWKSDPKAVAAAVAADLDAWPDFIDKSRGDKLIVVKVSPESDGSAGSRIFVMLGPRAGKAEVERLLGYALMNIAKNRGLPDLGFVAEGDGWRVLASSSKTVEENLKDNTTTSKENAKK